MKLYKYRLLTAIMAAAVIFASCSKDGVDNNSQSPSETNKTTQKLISFRQDLFSKNGGSMTSDSAEWHLEGLLNYEQANNTHEFIQVEFLYDTLTWPASNGVISYEGLQQVYASVNELAQSMALNNGNPDYTFDVIDLQVIETGLKSGEKDVVVTISGGLPGTTPTYIGFGTDDHWYWGWKAGKCDDFLGQYIGRDAAKELQDHFTNVPFQHSYFVSVVVVLAYPWDQAFQDDNNPFGNSMIFENTETSAGLTYCVSPEELNYYLSKFDYIKNFLKPIGKTYKTVLVEDDFIPTYSPFPIFHRYKLYYGVNIGSNPN
jgi:hypothetical protein